MSESQLPTSADNLSKKSTESSDNLANSQSHTSNVNVSTQDPTNAKDTDNTEYLTDRNRLEYLQVKEPAVASKAVNDPV